MVSEEIEIRVGEKIKPIRISISGSTFEEAKESLAQKLGQIDNLVPSDKELLAIVDAAKKEVNGILSEGKEFNCFAVREYCVFFMTAIHIECFHSALFVWDW